MHWDYVAILTLLAVIVPWRSNARVRLLLQAESLESRERIALYSSTIAFQWIISLLIMWRCSVHRLSLADLGVALPQPERAAVAAITVCAVLVLNQIFGVMRLAQLPGEQRGIIGQLAERILPRCSVDKWVALLLVLTVAICEEFIYRGFIQFLFQQTLRSVAAGAAISATLFALAHAYQGKRGVVGTFVVGLIFAGVRIWTGSILPSVIIHFAVDLSAGVASARLLARRAE